MKSVLVVGAGVAGLIAAVRLAKAGYDVIVLEARERVGGRILTAHAGDATVELGAEFVHGEPPELLALLQELDLPTFELTGSNFHYTPDGSLFVEDEAESEDEDDKDPFALLEQMTSWSEEHPAEDLSFRDYLSRQDANEKLASGATSYVEGFNAADASRISVRSLALQQRAEDSINGDRASHVRGGYARLPQALAERLARAGGSIRISAHVNEVTWSAGRVGITLTSGEVLEADTAIITLPLGVLQADAVRFTPSPANVIEDARRMAMGQVCRINLVFRTRWWAEIASQQHEALQQLSFLLPTELGGTDEPHFHVFWTGFPSLDPVLTAWSGGPAADRFAALTDHQIAHIACGDLARIFGVTQDQVLDQLVSHHSHDWQRDPFALGAYSWVPVGAVDASERMSLPVEKTLFFAGEHTDTTGHWGTVHGALRSGLRAAAQVLEAN
ncbi:flavin monoamine oxidase family protein [Terriglobus roseus]|uniref:Tryptophan 2-monooxygenase n=1 Tax=Terriglobus roseus TaxID=392734 RepID=A0A1H4L9C8_9BACT|nr:NAD(P)/FAD-dependent oxidoreductase [Terriglobus roseus]SEB67380.1 Monoamine oxidase [Terriglobus roseus]